MEDGKLDELSQNEIERDGSKIPHVQQGFYQRNGAHCPITAETRRREQ